MTLPTLCQLVRHVIGGKVLTNMKIGTQRLITLTGIRIVLSELLSGDRVSFF